jgi:hypothetical protein
MLAKPNGMSKKRAKSDDVRIVRIKTNLFRSVSGGWNGLGELRHRTSLIAGHDRIPEEA